MILLGFGYIIDIHAYVAWKIWQKCKAHGRIIRESKGQLERLENELRLLKGFLHDVGRNQAERSTELDLERQVKELAYDLEDIRESLLIHQASFTVAKSRVAYKLAREFRSTRDGRLDSLFRRIDAFGDLQHIKKHTTVLNQVPTVQLNGEVPPTQRNNPVGYQDETQALISSLLENVEDVDVIAITGMPGIGKTTMAWKIYQDDRIRTEFPTRIWVDIPPNFCSKDLHLHILKEFVKQGMPNHEELLTRLDISQESFNMLSYDLDTLIDRGVINDDELVHAVDACLKSRFLLVMDDLWSADTLESLRPYLPKKGKVLITSRNNRVNARKSHGLVSLKNDESWELLQLEVFGNRLDCPEILKSAGNDVARECDGSPLAILVVASSLVITNNDLTRNWWEKVSKDVTTYITDYSAQHKVFERVESSYTMLPQHLQQCFLYLGVFPQDHEIHVWTLIRLWIVEGLVLDSWGLTLEKVAQQNLYDLVSRNLVVVDKMHANGQIRTCHLHKLIYGFCKRKAAEEEFYHEIKPSRGGALDGPMPLTSNHRRLCINSCLSEFFSSRPNGQCVRSILCHNKEDEVLPLEVSFTVYKFFKLLKIFKCHGVKFRTFPEMLSKMILLRYISVSCCDSTGVIIIPECMASLCYLETLVVETELPTLEIRANIWKMLQLQNLVTKAAIVLAIKEKGKGKAGKNLQTLTRLAPASCTKEVFTRAPNLKKLGIRGQLSALSDSNSSFKELKFLERLKLINEPATRFQFPQDFFPPNLKRLTLSGTKLGWESIPILGKIDDLEILKLENNAFMGKTWKSTDADGFGCLKFLLIKGTDLVTWEASEHCFPRLKCLVLNNCAKLEKIPKTLESALAHWI